MTPEERSFEIYREHPTEEALLGLLRAHQDRVYNLSYQVLRQAEDAEDAAQNALLKAARGAAAIPDATGFRRWLYRITLTTALDVRSDRLRRRARERAYALSRESLVADGPDDVGHDLYRAIGALEDDLRDLVIRHFFEKASLRELAAQEGCSAVALWKKIEKGKARLREELTGLVGGSAPYALEGLLGGVRPVKAPMALIDPSFAVHSALSSAPSLSGGIAMATKGPAAAKLIATMILATTLGLGGGFAAGLSRGHKEVREAEDRSNGLSKELTAAKGEISRIRGDLSKTSLAIRRDPAEPGSAPAVKASDAPGTLEGHEKRARNDLRENLRRLVRMTIAAKKAGKSSLSTSDPEMADPENQKAMMTLMPYFMASHDPARAPEKYANLFGTGREVLMEELGFNLTGPQKDSLQVSTDRIRDVLERARNAPLSERGIARLEAEREFLIGLRDALAPDQKTQWIANQEMSLLPSANSDPQSFKILTGSEDAPSIVKVWASRYGLDQAQEISARASAQVFAESAGRIDQELSGLTGDTSAGASAGASPDLALQSTIYEGRIRILRAQLEALSPLQGMVAPEAWDRIQNTPLAEFVGPNLKKALGRSGSR
jgi:RNA polymerase sigma-70 factor (ECF subfamily)